MSKHIMAALKRFSEAERRRYLKTAERIWIERNVDLHVFNYWFYRYFTNRFEYFLLSFAKAKKSEGGKDE